MQNATSMWAFFTEYDSSANAALALEAAAIAKAGVAVDDVTNHYHNPVTTIPMDKYAGGEAMPLAVANQMIALRSTSASFRAQWNREFRSAGKTEIA